MFTHEDRKRSDAAMERASKIGEAIGIFFHKNTKGLIKGGIFLGCIIIVGSLCLLWSMAKKTIMGNKK